MLNDNASIAPEFENVEAALALAREQLAELEAKVKLARGTEDVAKEAAAAKAPVPVPSPPKKTIQDRIETALRLQILTTEELGQEIGEPMAKVASALRGVRKSLGNVGTPALARWTWRIGDQTTAEELTSVVQRLISDQPLTTAELVSATGARASRVGGALIALQRHPEHQIVDRMPTGRHRRWFILPKEAVSVKLLPKGKR